MPAAKKATKKVSSKQDPKKLVAGRSTRPRKPSRRQVERAVKDILDNSHATMFGRFYDLSQHESVDLAIEFYADLFEQINARVR